MAIPFADDLNAILDVDEFASSVSYRRKLGLGDSSIIGIFDNETVPVDAGGIASVHQEQPRFTCRTTDVPYIAENDVIIVSSIEYRVVAWLHDGTGVTTLQLEKQ
jgi:hypothetical protein